jgi:hypothetical protein
MDYECTGKVQDSDGPPDIKQILISMFMNFGQVRTALSFRTRRRVSYRGAMSRCTCLLQESPNFTLYSGMNFTQQPMVLIWCAYS